MLTDRPLFHLCLHLARLMEARLARLCAELEVGHGQARVIMDLAEHGPSRPTLIAQRIFISAPTLTVLLRPLIARGLCARNPDPAHGGARIVSLTRSGARLVDVIQAAWDELEGAVRSQLTADDIESARTLLLTMRTNLGVPEDPLRRSPAANQRVREE